MAFLLFPVLAFSFQASAVEEKDVASPANSVSCEDSLSASADEAKGRFEVAPVLGASRVRIMPVGSVHDGVELATIGEAKEVRVLADASGPALVAVLTPTHVQVFEVFSAGEPRVLFSSALPPGPATDLKWHADDPGHLAISYTTDSGNVSVIEQILK